MHEKKKYFFYVFLKKDTDICLLVPDIYQRRTLHFLKPALLMKVITNLVQTK